MLARNLNKQSMRYFYAKLRDEYFLKGERKKADMFCDINRSVSFDLGEKVGYVKIFEQIVFHEYGSYLTVEYGRVYMK
jgi:hypothetical protein